MRPLALALALCASTALADAIDVSLANTTVIKGRGAPQVRVQILERIAGFKLNLTRGDGRPFEWKGGGAPGVTRTVELDAPVGKTSWKGLLTVNLPNASTASMSLEFETVVALPLELKLDKDQDVDLARRTITFRLNNPAGKAHLTVLLESGDVAFDGEVPFEGEAPGTPLSVSWPDLGAKPLKLSLKAYDAFGVYVGVEFFPWSFEIPHDDVTFDSGKWDIKPDEQRKLDEAASRALDAIRRFGRFADVTLFVAGHTDTRGPSASNRTLSLNRARAIATYFRQKGVKIPIRYEGFGEEVPAVATADEVDEVQNRRVQYIIAIDAPRLSNASFNPKWPRL
ncbi:MAG: OmpA family protein [Myxococcaceae bacterium]|jgi:outer membrane protein OmpA-like peptidoglycan-associated protein|nr:OmpA family protein [Myxococcaceae bacterium]